MLNKARHTADKELWHFEACLRYIKRQQPQPMCCCSPVKAHIRWCYAIQLWRVARECFQSHSWHCKRD